MNPRRMVFLLGVVVVVIQLIVMVTAFRPDPHDGGDNAGYVALAGALAGGDGYVELWDPDRPPHTKYPPFFPALLAIVVAMGGVTWTSLKVVPAAATTIAVLLTFLWASRRRGAVFGATVALLLALAPGARWYSQWILSDAPFVALFMLALYSLERFASNEARENPGRDRTAMAWLGLGLVATALATLTRSAGLPLVVALGVWLAVRRRTKELLAYGAVVVLPTVLWSLRSRTPGEGSYVSEFWLVDPYQPALGSIDAGGMVERIATNAQMYAVTHLPTGLVGSGGVWGILLVIALTACAGLGWVVALRKQRHVAEIFVPIYVGLILVWPAVWGGDRFALPLLPLLLVYAGAAVVDTVAGAVAERMRSEGHRAIRVTRVAVGVVCTAALLLPQARTWRFEGRLAARCAELIEAPGASAFACRGGSWEDYTDAALWASHHLPDDAVVLSRKPRIFYALSGISSRTYPFTEDVREFFAGAESARADYVLFDGISAQGVTYVGGVVARRPEAFCAVKTFDRGRLPTTLFGIVDPDLGIGGSIVRGGEGPRLDMPDCPESMGASGEIGERPGPEVPILRELRPVRSTQSLGRRIFQDGETLVAVQQRERDGEGDLVHEIPLFAVAPSVGKKIADDRDPSMGSLATKYPFQAAPRSGNVLQDSIENPSPQRGSWEPSVQKRSVDEAADHALHQEVGHVVVPSLDLQTSVEDWGEDTAKVGGASPGECASGESGDAWLATWTPQRKNPGGERAGAERQKHRSGLFGWRDFGGGGIVAPLGGRFVAGQPGKLTSVLGERVKPTRDRGGPGALEGVPETVPDAVGVGHGAM